MESVVQRLEAVASRLESFESGLKVAGKSQIPAGSAPKETATSHGTQRSAASKPVIISVEPPVSVTMADWESLLQQEYLSLGKAVDTLPEVFRPSTKILESGAQCMIDVVKKSQSSSKPSQEDFQAMLAPLADAIKQVDKLIRGPRTPATNHHRAISECLQSFAWVSMDPALGAPPPEAVVSEGMASCEMFATKVMMEYRTTAPGHKEWAAALKKFMTKLQSLVSKGCPKGLEWKGPSSATPAEAKETPPPPQVSEPLKRQSGPPPPPPPPPPGFLEEKFKAANSGQASGGGRSELMAALNCGSGVTSGLKKVTSDMKTKNQTNRSGVVKASEPKAVTSVARGPSRKELQQNRWIVENWAGAEEPVVLEEGELKRSHAVYISKCSQCVIQVKGKVNTIMLDGCVGVGIIFPSVVGTVEVVNCKSCQVQCEQTCPTLSIDKSDGAKVFLSEEAAQVSEVITSKCSTVSVTVLPNDSSTDPVVHPVPEQFVSKVVDGKLVTTPVTHL